MKRIIALAGMAVLLCAIAFPVLAAEGVFTPSVTYKGAPEVVTVTDTGSAVSGGMEEEEIAVIGVIRTEGEVTEVVKAGEITITTIANIDTVENVSEESKTQLKTIYEELSSGQMVLPYEKVEGVQAENLVVRELMDLSWVGNAGADGMTYEEMLEEEGVTAEFTFNLGIGKDDVIIVMVYVDGEWIPMTNVVNNGDGTVTCAFDYLGPTVFVVESGEHAALQETTQTEE